MSSVEFPSQDPAKVAEILASDEYQREQAEKAEREAQEKRLAEWFDGSQRNARDADRYFKSRPYEDAEGIHDPVTEEIVEAVDKHTNVKKRQGRWGNRYFEESRGNYYDDTHENPAELDAFDLANRYIDAEIAGDKTFAADYGKVLAQKLSAPDVSVIDLAELQAEAEFESEISESGAPQTVELIAKAIDKHVMAFHNKNIGSTGAAYEIHGEDGGSKSGKLRTVRPLQDATIRDERFRARIERKKEKFLAELREQNADLIEEFRNQQSPQPDDSGDVAPEETDGLDIPTWVSGDQSAASDDGDGGVEEASEAETDVLDAEGGEASETDDASEAEQAQPRAEVKEQETEAQKQAREFQETVAKWGVLLQDPRYVPSRREYDAIVDLAKHIDFRHKDPETEKDGQSGMGYFMTGTNTRLSPYFARTVLDKAKAREWVFANDYELGEANDFLHDDLQEAFWSIDEAEAMHRAGKFPTIMSFYRFIELDGEAEPSDENIRRYQAYIKKRLTLDEYLYVNYPNDYYQQSVTGKGRQSEISEEASETEDAPEAPAEAEQKPETPKQGRRSLRSIAASGLRNVAQRAREARERRRQQAEEAARAEEEAAEAEEQPTEEKPAS